MFGRVIRVGVLSKTPDLFLRGQPKASPDRFSVSVAGHVEESAVSVVLAAGVAGVVFAYRLTTDAAALARDEELGNIIGVTLPQPVGQHGILDDHGADMIDREGMPGAAIIRRSAFPAPGDRADGVAVLAR